MPELRRDQLQDLGMLFFKHRRHIHRGDPGTGKTPTICMLQKARWTEHGQGTVWPMPMKLRDKNLDEAMAWGDWDAGDVVIVNGPADIRANPTAKVFIMGFERFKLSWRLLPPHVRSIDIDEWHKGFGGHESKRTQALYEFCDERVRDDGWFIPMTGTLFNGKPDTVYPALQIIAPTYYGTLKCFQQVHHLVDPFTGKLLGYRDLDVLEDIVRQHSISRRWSDIHGPEEVVAQVERVEMGARQRAAYDEFKEQGLLELEQFFVDGTQPGTAFIRARQIMEHPNHFPNLAALAAAEAGVPFDGPEFVDIAPGEPPGKLELFELDCERHLANGTPFVVFAALVPQQEQLYATAQRLGLSVGLLNGSTSRKEADRIDREFRAGRLQCIVASPLVADCGFNWQTWGDVEVPECIFASLPFQDTAIAQAYKRFMRRARKVALRIKIYAYINSLDAHIMRLTKRKASDAAQVEPGRQPLPF